MNETEGTILAHRLELAEEALADHEQRIRTLERATLGIAAGIGVIVAEIPIALWIAARLFSG